MTFTSLRKQDVQYKSAVYTLQKPPSAKSQEGPKLELIHLLLNPAQVQT